MSNAVAQNNIYDEKMYLAQKLLNEGKTRFEVARAVGYKGVDGLDRYAKGLGYTWNVAIKNYELKEGGKISNSQVNPQRIRKILAMIEKGIELNKVAKFFRMKNAEELAEYMKNKGYVWQVEKGNYVRKNSIFNDTNENYLDYKSNDDKREKQEDIISYLQANRGKLIELLSYKSNKAVPRYLLKGMPVTKGFFISVDMDRLVKEFSREKNILQKDIIQTALIEFFQKYGFENEVNAILKN